MNTPKKQFCKNGHDTFITGRYEGNKKCIACTVLPSEQFCLRGHDTFITGRFKSNGGCVACKKEKYEETYVPKIRSPFCPKGHDKDVVGKDTQGKCVECKKEHIKKWRQVNQDHVTAYEKEYNIENAEKVKARHQQYNEEHREEINAWTRQYQRDHPEMVRATNIKQQTNRNVRIVAWTDWNNIRKIDANCPKGMEVDHFIPLCGKKVAGLHVSWNLQYLTPHENRVKWSNVDLLEASAWYGKILEQAGLK